LIATAVGGIPELIKDHHNGLLVPTDDIEALAAACRELLDDHALTARLGRQAWIDLPRLYGPDVIARQTISAYEDASIMFKRSRKARG